MNLFENNKFIKSVENWVQWNEQKYIDQIIKVKNHIPVTYRTSSVPLYRGMVLSDDAVLIMKNGGSLPLTGFSSWAVDKNMAIRFVKDSSKRINFDARGNGVIFKKKIPNDKIILHIQNLFFTLDATGLLDQMGVDELTADDALKEGEVLVDKGIKLTSRDITQEIKL